MDWEKLAATSHYQTAVAVKEELLNENLEEATRGIEELIEALSRSDKRALRSQLTRLMTHIIQWRIQPERRSRSWQASITNVRLEIAALLEDEPNQRTNLPQLWNQCFVAAKRLAHDETGIEPKVGELTHQEVFEQLYQL
jgi:hypothetical protein